MHVHQEEKKPSCLLTYIDVERAPLNHTARLGVTEERRAALTYAFQVTCHIRVGIKIKS
jgi:hypothetical protein